LITKFPIVIFPLICHLSFEEILKEKIKALLTRGKGRDIFDLWFLIHKRIPFDREFVQAKMKFYNESYDKTHVLDTIYKFDDKSLDQDLRRFLPKSERSIIPELKRLLLDSLKNF
ncbi:MAG: nucleotidyl transferase AbiEii/AbiGii toxin family protein, partial [Patescibacteria group bacterium]|nr:nucleotidyl transferase AbiEii/AbiGii toxin family protein [Patescibacteria group bacterium]